MPSSDYPEYVAQNVAVWTRNNAKFTGPNARAAWAEEDMSWGVFTVPESELNVYGDVSGLDVLDLGCGTAYLSAWMAKRGARPVGVDPTPAQLETAREMQKEFGLEFPLLEAVGEDVPLADASFDLVASEFGASIWADPYRWIPEAARLLRPGGRLVFLRNSTLSLVCMDLDGATQIYDANIGGGGDGTMGGAIAVNFPNQANRPISLSMGTIPDSGVELVAATFA